MVYVCQLSTNQTASLFLPMLVTGQPPAIHAGASTLAVFFHINTALTLTSSALNITNNVQTLCEFERTKHKHSVSDRIAEKALRSSFEAQLPHAPDLHYAHCFCIRLVLTVCFVKDEVGNNEVTNTIENTGASLRDFTNSFLYVFNIQNEKCVENV